MHINPLIFSITRASMHDGPGVRTVVYFKGCNMRCSWCHNPEGLESKKELFFNKNKCVGCRRCTAICSNISDIGVINRNLCVSCGRCAEACPANALSVIGDEMSTDDVLEIIIKDKEYYNLSGGGVTLSGGECLLYPDFVAELLKKCRNSGVHTLVESALNVPWPNFEKVIPYTDMFYIDIKHMNTGLHKKYTGCGNELIFDNITKLSHITKNILIRTPVIPNVNDSEENLKAIEYFAENLGLKSERLMYNNLAKSKYDGLDKTYISYD